MPVVKAAAVQILIVGMVEHLGVAPAVQEALKSKDKLVNKGPGAPLGSESLPLRHII